MVALSKLEDLLRKDLLSLSSLLSPELLMKLQRWLLESVHAPRRCKEILETQRLDKP